MNIVSLKKKGFWRSFFFSVTKWLPVPARRENNGHLGCPAWIEYPQMSEVEPEHYLFHTEYIICFFTGRGNIVSPTFARSRNIMEIPQHRFLVCNCLNRLKFLHAILISYGWHSFVRKLNWPVSVLDRTQQARQILLNTELKRRPSFQLCI